MRQKIGIFSLDQKNNIIKLYPIENLRVGFILIIFLKFYKCQPRYSYKKYILTTRIYR